MDLLCIIIIYIYTLFYVNRMMDVLYLHEFRRIYIYIYIYRTMLTSRGKYPKIALIQGIVVIYSDTGIGQDNPPPNNYIVKIAGYHKRDVTSVIQIDENYDHICHVV